jgi:hypothetical protein
MPRHLVGLRTWSAYAAWFRYGSLGSPRRWLPLHRLLRYTVEALNGFSCRRKDSSWNAITISPYVRRLVLRRRRSLYLI